VKYSVIKALYFSCISSAINVHFKASFMTLQGFLHQTDAEEMGNGAPFGFYFWSFSCLLCSSSMYIFAFPVSKICMRAYAVESLYR